MQSATNPVLRFKSLDLSLPVVKPALKDLEEVRPLAWSKQIFAVFRCGKAPAVAAAGEDMQLTGNLALNHLEIIAQAVLGRYGLIVLAEEEKSLRRRGINLILKGIVFDQVYFVVGKIGTGALVGHILLEGYYRIYQHAEVGTGCRIDPERGSAGCQMPACREADDSKLLDSPLFLVGAAVAESILHIGQGHLAMMVGHTVKHHAAGYSVLEAPGRHASTLVIRGAILISASGAANQHLAVTLLGEINVDVRVVDIGEKPVAGQFVSSSKLIVVARAEGYAYSVFNYTLIDRLALGIKLEGH